MKQYKLLKDTLFNGKGISYTLNAGEIFSLQKDHETNINYFFHKRTGAKFHDNSELLKK